MKPYYADYVNHVLRFYVQSSGRKTTNFETVADHLNYQAADRVLTSLDERDRGILCEVFDRSVEPLLNRVLDVAHARKIPSGEIWTLISRVSRRIAEERNLIGGGA